MRISRVIEKEILHCIHSRRFWFGLVGCVALAGFMFLRSRSEYLDYFVIFGTIWIMNNFLIDLLVYRDKIEGVIRFLPGLRIGLFEVVLAKALFITFTSVFVSCLTTNFGRIAASVFGKPISSLGQLPFVIAIPVDFLIICIAVLIQLRFEVSRPIRLLFVGVFVVFLEAREIVLNAGDHPRLIAAAVLVVIAACSLVVIRLRDARVEDYF